MCILDDFQDPSVVFGKSRLYLKYKFKKAQNFVTQAEKLLCFKYKLTLLTRQYAVFSDFIAFSWPDVFPVICSLCTEIEDI